MGHTDQHLESTALESTTLILSLKENKKQLFFTRKIQGLQIVFDIINR